MNLLERGWVSGQRAVIDGYGAEIGIAYGELGRESASHAPADGSDAAGVDIFQSLKIICRGDEVADTAILREAAHELVGSLRVGGYFAAIKIDGEGNVALGGKIGCLLFDPVVESPPFMDDNQRRVWSGGGWRIKKTLDRLVTAGKGNGRGL